MNKRNIRDLDLKGKRVLMRVDFNVPMEDGRITNDVRIRRAVPTIKYVMDAGGKLVLMSHLGRPKDKVVDGLRMGPVADRLGELLGIRVKKLTDCIGPAVEKVVNAMKPGEVALLENLRFHPGEKAGDADFIDALSRLGDVYVNDAFGTAHRPDASVAGIAKKLPSGAGFLLAAEIDYLGKVLSSPDRPLVVVLGGAKVSDKIGTVENLVKMADKVMVGGAMAYTFLAAQGRRTGSSKLEADKIDVASRVLEIAEKKGMEVLLPVDHMTAREFSADSETKVQKDDIEDGWMGLDVGPETAENYCSAMKGAGTIVWNGTMGVCEMEPFAVSSRKLADVMAASGATTIVGGGDTVAAVEMFGLQERFDHISTGGGAFLEFMEGRELPGVASLPDA